MGPTIKLSEQCERCPREILTTVSAEEAVARAKLHGTRPRALVVIANGKELVSYGRLCEECAGICAAAVEAVRPQTKKSARRAKRVGEEAQEPPAAVRAARA